MKSPHPWKQATRQSHEAKRYPGDLAADLGLAETSALSPWAWRSFALAASVAIAASLLWWLNRTPTGAVTPEADMIAIELTTEPPTQTAAPATHAPATLGVRLSEIPTLKLSRTTDRPSRFSSPSSPPSFNFRSTPKRFLRVDFKRPDSSSPSSRRPQHELPADRVV